METAKIETREEGKAEITSEIAKEMKKEGLAIQLIAKATKLTKELIREL